jgi:Spy/CpxP family protein refolding chaperone
MTKRHAFLGKALWWTAVALLWVGTGAVPSPSRAEDPPAKETSALGQKAEHPLPKHFDKLNLTAKQKEKVIAIMDECDEKVAYHLNEIRRLRGKPFVTAVIIAHAKAAKSLRGQCQAGVEKVLDDAQRAKLKELRSKDGAGK